MRVKMLTTVGDYREGQVFAVETPLAERLIRERNAVAVSDGGDVPIGGVTGVGWTGSPIPPPPGTPVVLPTGPLTTWQVDHFTHQMLDRAEEDVLHARLALEQTLAAQRAAVSECRRMREAVGL